MIRPRLPPVSYMNLVLSGLIYGRSYQVTPLCIKTMHSMLNTEARILRVRSPKAIRDV